MSPDDLTAAFFSEVLDAEVRPVDRRPIGDGLVGMNLRVELEVAAPDRDRIPESLVVKLPSADPTSRATGVALRNYEREVRFYSELATTVDIRVPHCHHAEWSAADGDFVLVLEDMAPATQGDQVAGCSVDAARSAIDELAKLHGPRWDDAGLDSIEWLSRRGPDDLDQLLGLWQMFLPGFLTTFRRHLTEEQAAVLDAFGPRLGPWLDARSGPRTVTHGDFRLDNLLFGASPDGSAPAVTAVDWQTPGQSIGAADLSYFIGAGLLRDDRREAERELVARYASGLAVYGIDVDESGLWDDYRRESFAGVVMAVIASQVVGTSERSESMFAAMASRHLQQALDHDSIELISV